MSQFVSNYDRQHETGVFVDAAGFVAGAGRRDVSQSHKFAISSIIAADIMPEIKVTRF